MPIKKCWQVIAVVCAITVGAAAPAYGAAETPPPVPPLDDASCAHPEFTQALLPFGDANLYTLAPGGAFSNAVDWQLAGGATITEAVQPDGSVGGVLDMPGKSQATSPVMCITSDYPTARLWSRIADADEDVSFSVQYWDAERQEWTEPKVNGKFKADRDGAWELSTEMDIKPSDDPGWQQVRFTLHVQGNPERHRVQVDNFWVDPRASR